MDREAKIRELEKRAFMGAIGRGLGAVGRGIGRAAGSAVRAPITAAGAAASGVGRGIGSGVRNVATSAASGGGSIGRTVGKGIFNAADYVGKGVINTTGKGAIGLTEGLAGRSYPGMRSALNRAVVSSHPLARTGRAGVGAAAGYGAYQYATDARRRHTLLPYIGRNNG